MKSPFIQAELPKKTARAIAVLAALLALVLLVLGVLEKGRLQQAARVAQGRKIEQGAALYEVHCRTCHGPRGEGVGQLGPALSDAHFFTNRLAEVGWQQELADYIHATIACGRMMATRPMYAGNGSTAVMVPWARSCGGLLGGHEIDQLTAYLLNWRETAMGETVLQMLELPTIGDQDPQTIARGREVFRQSCARCHRFGEFTSPETAGPVLDGIAARAGERRQGLDGREYLRESILVPDAFISEEFAATAAQHPCNSLLSETELVAVISFLLQDQGESRP